MKKTLLIVLTVMFGFAVMAQRAQVKSDIPSERAIFADKVDPAPANTPNVGQSHKVNLPANFKGTDVVSIVSIGTSANAYGYGYGGGQKSLVNVNNDLGVVTNFHRMGGELDPGGYSGDMGYDVSFDLGMTWTNMVECYVATENAGGEYFLDAGRYPNHGVYNPPGNTDPTNAYLAFFAPNLDGSNSSDSWGGYSYGVHKLGSAPNVDTTKHLLSSDPPDKMQYIPDAYAMVSANNEYWVGDFNQDWSSGALVYLNEMIISHGIWDETENDFVLEQFFVDAQMQDALGRPANQKIEFSSDGQIGYIATLGDNGEVEISKDYSYYPIIWRTEDGGETWSDAIPVAIAGEDGIVEVQNYLSDEEIAELFLEPLPDRDEIPFTTAFDFDLSVDSYGNPAIAVMVGVSADQYSIASGISPSSGYLYTSAFLLHSTDKGEEGSWFGHEMGRPVSFRGNFGDLTEDNRIQISRSPAGDKMFVAWLDTDTTVSAENNAPDIWARGIDLMENKMTLNDAGEDRPTNVTFGSEATFSAYFFALGNEVFDDGNGNYTIPFVYENMTPTDPAQPVQFKYIQDFMWTDADFILVDVEENPIVKADFAEVSQTVPNPAVNTARFNVTLREPSNVSVAVTNMMGQTVQVLPTRTMQAGSNQVTIDVTDLSSGVYFYTVEAGAESITKKMIVK
jgi:hypothetical protein